MECSGVECSGVEWSGVEWSGVDNNNFYNENDHQSIALQSKSLHISLYFIIVWSGVEWIITICKMKMIIKVLHCDLNHYTLSLLCIAFYWSRAFQSGNDYQSIALQSKNRVEWNGV